MSEIKAGDAIPKAAYKNLQQRYFTISDIEQRFSEAAPLARKPT